MPEITSRDIIERFYSYAKSQGYILKVVGDYAMRNKKRKIIRYIKYNRELNSILLYEEGAGRYHIPLIPKDLRDETTRQKRIPDFMSLQ